MENRLRNLIKSNLEGARRIAVLGIGSELRGDDASGIIAASYIARSKAVRGNVRVEVFFGDTAPENITGEIKKFKPSHLVIIDTVDAGQKPGTILVIDPDTAGGASFSTHTMPAKILAMYLKRSTRCKTAVIGIQAKSVRFGDAVSKEAAYSAQIVSRAFIKTVKSLEASHAKTGKRKHL